MKKLVCLIAALLAALLLVSCSAGSENTVTQSESLTDTAPTNPTETEPSDFAQSLSLAELSAEIDKAMSNSDKLSAVEGDYLEYSMMLDKNLAKDFVVKIQVEGTEADMYGLFETASDSDASALAQQVNAYLTMMKENLENFNYMPSENVKFEDAKAIYKGNHVFFIVASSSEREAAENLFNGNY